MRTVFFVFLFLLPFKALAGETLKLLSAEPVSLTEINLSFNHPVSVDPKKAPFAFLVVDENRQPLPLTRLVLNGSSVTLLTAPQQPLMSYAVYVSNIVFGMSSQTAFLLDSIENKTVFTSQKEYVLFEEDKSAPSPVAASLLAKEMMDASALSQNLSKKDFGMVIFVMIIGAIVGWSSVRVFQNKT